MSTRGSVFHHHDPKTDITVHIFEECAIGVRNDIRLEAEFPQGVINVAWPRQAFDVEMLERASRKRLI
jgi:hypothetical protein